MYCIYMQDIYKIHIIYTRHLYVRRGAVPSGHFYFMNFFREKVTLMSSVAFYDHINLLQTGHNLLMY